MKPRFFAGFFLIPLFILLFTACSTESGPETSFYYWRSNFNPGSREKGLLKTQQVSALYVKYFDLVFEGGVKPVSAVRFSEKPVQSVVPVVYITNEVFKKCGAGDVDSIASRTLRLINDINTAANIKPVELQFDCDWTESTRDKFFRFVSAVKKNSTLPVSVTVRLHQVKYRDITGIPPVERAVLMYYNVGKITADTLNSIYTREIADKYVSYLEEYPLQLDVALPLFSWGIQSREGEVIQLLNKMNESNFLLDTFFIQTAKNTFSVKHSCFNGGYYFKKDDRIKIEFVTEVQLMEMAEDISDNINFKPRRIIYYDLDSINLKRYNEKIFSEINSYFN